MCAFSVGAIVCSMMLMADKDTQWPDRQCCPFVFLLDYMPINRDCCCCIGWLRRRRCQSCQCTGAIQGASLEIFLCILHYPMWLSFSIIFWLSIDRRLDYHWLTDSIGASITRYFSVAFQLIHSPSLQSFIWPLICFTTVQKQKASLNLYIHLIFISTKKIHLLNFYFSWLMLLTVQWTRKINLIHRNEGKLKEGCVNAWTSLSL